LTNLFNRRYMEETLVREIRTAQRNQTMIAIIMLDIDHFKHFNDSFGHAAGDALLRGIGGMLQTEIRGGDLACRYGGEEFTIILPETDLQAALEIAEKLRRKVKLLQIQLNGAKVGEVTISLGVAAYPQHGATWEDVLHAADMALLKAKQTRDRSVIFEI
jgi:diguanylate cyclase (GGDEF)-like protein